VSVQEANVIDMIRERHDAFDALLLDVDNGPSGLSRDSNDWLYSHAGLRASHRALREGGILGVWSVAPDRGFTKRLGEAGFEAEEHAARARRTRGGRHTLWLGVRSVAGVRPKRSGGVGDSKRAPSSGRRRS
jgi:spermidine synthase